MGPIELMPSLVAMCNSILDGECQVKRDLGSLQTAQLGPTDCVAFLGAWAAVTDKFETRAGHGLRIPPLSAVRAFVTEEGWPAEA